MAAAPVTNTERYILIAALKFTLGQITEEEYWNQYPTPYYRMIDAQTLINKLVNKAPVEWT